MSIFTIIYLNPLRKERMRLHKMKTFIDHTIMFEYKAILSCMRYLYSCSRLGISLSQFGLLPEVCYSSLG